MAEILTESFCERCGSRYTFESAVPRARLRGVKVLSRGLKNFVLDDKTSIDEAMAAARDDTDRSLTSQQLEAFHKTFNFCMQCRQYICPNCWNDGEGRCLTCAPTLGRGILPAPFPNLDPSAGIAAAPEDGLAAAAMNGHTHVGDGSNGNGFDTIARVDTLSQAAPVEMIGSEVEAHPAVEPDAVAPAIVEPGVDAAAAGAPAPTSLHAPVAEPEPERFIYDPYDPPPPAPPKAIVAEVVADPVFVASEPEVVEPAAAEAHEAPTAEPEVVVEAPVAAEPEAVAEAAAVAPVVETIAAEDAVVETGTAAPSDETEAASDRAAALAAETSLLLAGLRPGQSLDEALAEFEAEPGIDEAAEAVAAEAAEAVVAPEAVAPEAVAAEAVVAPEAVAPEAVAAEAVVAPEAVAPEAVAAEAVVAPEAVAPEAVAAEAVVAPEAVAAEAVVAPEESAAPEPIEHPLADAAVIAALASTPTEAETPIAPEAAEPTEPDAAVLAAAAAVLAAAAAPVVDQPVEAAPPEPVAFVEPLDEIPLGDSVAFEPAVDAQPEAEPEPAWEAEPLDDIVPAEAAAESPVEAVPEPAAIEAAPEPAAPPVPESPEIAAAAVADDIVAQPTWSIVAPEPQPIADVPGPLADGPAPTIEPVAPAAQATPPESAEPSWPAQPQWPSAQPSAGLPFLGRHAVPTGGVDALWAESSQAVSAPRVGADKPAGGVQPCTSCGLSLSASARFCRRCGTSQVG